MPSLHMRPFVSTFALTLLLSLLSGCATTSRMSDTTAAATDVVVEVPSPVDPRWPISADDYRTTSSAIYLGNLDARIDSLRGQVSATADARYQSALAGSLYHRYRVLGRFEDAEQAMTLIDAAVAAAPTLAESLQLRAVIRSGFHRFDEALQDLEAARNAGAPEPALLNTRTEIQLALGQYDALHDAFKSSGEVVPDFNQLASRADLRVQLGDLEGATFMYRAAQTQVSDVNPVPLAWLHVQQGIALLRFGKVESARRFFAAAHERMPEYYLATEHLAECETLLGNLDAARALYAQVIGQTGNPEFIAALASLEQGAGNQDRADQLAAEAMAGYEALQQRYPAAFGQHAAEFLVEHGHADRALVLAEQNIELRQDIGSWILLSQAALAAGKVERACEARQQALATGLHPPEVSQLDALAARCG